MLRLLGFILLGFPLLELVVTIGLAMVIGAWIWVLLIASAVIGIMLLRGQKTALPFLMVNAVKQGRNPLTGMLWSGRIALAGVLLIIPGVLSDILALIVLLAWTPKIRNPVDPVSHQDIKNIIEGEFRQVDKSRDHPQ